MFLFKINLETPLINLLSIHAIQSLHQYTYNHTMKSKTNCYYSACTKKVIPSDFKLDFRTFLKKLQVWLVGWLGFNGTLQVSLTATFTNQTT